MAQKQQPPSRTRSTRNKAGKPQRTDSSSTPPVAKKATRASTKSNGKENCNVQAQYKNTLALNKSGSIELDCTLSVVPDRRYRKEIANTEEAHLVTQPLEKLTATPQSRHGCLQSNETTAKHIIAWDSRSPSPRVCKNKRRKNIDLLQRLSSSTVVDNSANQDQKYQTNLRGLWRDDEERYAQVKHSTCTTRRKQANPKIPSRVPASVLKEIQDLVTLARPAITGDGLKQITTKAIRDVNDDSILHLQSWEDNDPFNDSSFLRKTVALTQQVEADLYNSPSCVPQDQYDASPKPSAIYSKMCAGSTTPAQTSSKEFVKTSEFPGLLSSTPVTRSRSKLFFDTSPIIPLSSDTSRSPSLGSDSDRQDRAENSCTIRMPDKTSSVAEIPCKELATKSARKRQYTNYKITPQERKISRSQTKQVSPARDSYKPSMRMDVNKFGHSNLKHRLQIQQGQCKKKRLKEWHKELSSSVQLRNDISTEAETSTMQIPHNIGSDMERCNASITDDFLLSIAMPDGDLQYTSSTKDDAMLSNGTYKQESNVRTRTHTSSVDNDTSYKGNSEPSQMSCSRQVACVDDEYTDAILSQPEVIAMLDLCESQAFGCKVLPSMQRCSSDEIAHKRKLALQRRHRKR